MPEINPVMPTVGLPHATEDPKVRSALITIRNAINGGLDSANWEPGSIEAVNIDDALAAALGINNGTNEGRDYATVATSESTTSASFTDLATAGPSITLTVPTNGFVNLYAEALITGPTTGASFVGIYEATDHATPVIILSQAQGVSGTRYTSPGYAAGVTAVGGFISIPATAGTRTYTLKYARVDLGSGASGNATFANRKLWGVAGGP